MTNLSPARSGRTTQALPARPSPSPAPVADPVPDPATLIEQAKAVLMSRYDLDPPTAAGLLLVWSAQQQITPLSVADALVHDICEGGRPTTEPELVRWLEQCLRNLP